MSNKQLTIARDAAGTLHPYVDGHRLAGVRLTQMQPIEGAMTIVLTVAPKDVRFAEVEQSEVIENVIPLARARASRGR